MTINPAGMRCLWEISIKPPLRETSQRPLRNISKKMTFLWQLYDDVSNKFKKTCLVWRPQDVSSISQKRCLLCDASETSQKHLSQVFVILCRVITISDKTDVGPLRKFKKLNVFWEQCIDINEVCREHQWADICVRVLASQWSSKLNGRCIIYYF